MSKISNTITITSEIGRILSINTSGDGTISIIVSETSGSGQIFMASQEDAREIASFINRNLPFVAGL